MKYSTEKIDEICNFIRAGNTHRDAALLSDITESTFYEWAKDSEFSERLKKAEQECKARNIAFIQKAAEKSWQAAAWFLERRYHDEYAVKQVNEVTGAGGEPVRLLINTGQGFVPATIKTDATPESGASGESPKIQSSNLAPESPKDIHIDNGNGQTSSP